MVGTGSSLRTFILPLNLLSNQGAVNLLKHTQQH